MHALLAIVERLMVLHQGRKLLDGEPHAVMASREVREIYLGVEPAMVDAALLAIDNLDAFYGDVPGAVRRLAPRIEKGETIAIIGANGAGKTTLDEIHRDGLVRARAGTIRFKGEDISGLETHRIVARGIALAPEGRRLFPSLSVEENLARRRTGQTAGAVVAGEDIRAVSRAEASGVRNLRRRCPAANNRWCAIGRALMANPDLILIDELSPRPRARS